MNIFRLSLAYLRQRPLTTALNVAMLALGLATIVVLLLAAHQLEERMTRDARGIDMVIGAKGSPMQLVLAGIYHLDVPPGNIPLTSAKEIAKHPMVKAAIPLALGDSYKGFRIVGAPLDYPALYGAKPAQGVMYAQALEVVLGAEAAVGSGLKVGDEFAGSHGLGEGGEAHNEAKYRVVGILHPTGAVVDRLVLCNVESVWKVHEKVHEIQPGTAEAKILEEEREVTMLLIQYKSPLAAAMLPRAINQRGDVQAAAPALELARLFRLVGVGVDVVKGFAVVLILAAALGLVATLTAALRERRYDLAVLRTLGASRGKVFGLMLLEGVALAFAGAVLGIVLGHLLMGGIGWWLAQEKSVPMTGWIFLWEEAALLAGALVLGALAACGPAWAAYRSDVAGTLAQSW